MKRSSRFVYLLMVVTFVSRVILAFRPEIKLAERPYQEDAFYLFTCASQLAQGHGFSIDGVHATNGVQPLVVVLYAPFFMLADGDRWLGLRLTFVLVGLLEAFCVYAVYRLILVLGRDSRYARASAMVAAVLWTGLYTLLVHHANGLETGLMTALYLAVLWLYSLMLQERASSMRQQLALGVLLGFLILSRIDTCVFVAMLLGIELIRHRFSIDAFRRCLVIGACAIAISAPWWIYNITLFGDIMPISGRAEALESLQQVNFYTAMQALGDMLTVFFYSGYNLYAPWLSVVWGILMLVMWTMICIVTKVHLRVRHEFDLRPLLPMVLTGLALAIYYIGFFSAPHFIARYLHPLRIATFLGFVMMVPLLIEWMRIRRNSFTRRTLGAIGILTAVLAVVFNVALYLRAFTTPNSPPVYHAGLFAKSVSPLMVGMTSSGTASFISPNVVNLDGKVNADALLARKNNRLGEYVVKANIDYVADWKDMSYKIAQQAARVGADYRLIDSVGPIFVYKRFR